MECSSRLGALGSRCQDGILCAGENGGHACEKTGRAQSRDAHVAPKAGRRQGRLEMKSPR